MTDNEILIRELQRDNTRLRSELEMADKELVGAQEAIESGVRLHRGDPAKGLNALCNCPSCVWLIKRRLNITIARQQWEGEKE